MEVLQTNQIQDSSIRCSYERINTEDMNNLSATNLKDLFDISDHTLSRIKNYKGFPEEFGGHDSLYWLPVFLSCDFWQIESPEKTVIIKKTKTAKR